MKISIAMATYNGHDYLLEQLESFLTQTRMPDELVITDDGSSDDTKDIVREFSRKAPFPVIFYANDARLGYSLNFSKAIMRASGEIIFISDQDDCWFENKIEKVLEEFDDDNVMCVTNDQIIANQDLEPVDNTKLSNVRRLGLPDEWFVTGCCTAVRKEWVDIVCPVPKGFPGHDLWINRLADLFCKRKILEEPLQLYRRHDHNVSSAEASSVKKVSKLTLWLKYGLRPSIEGWKKRVENLKSYENIVVSKKEGFVKYSNMELFESVLSQLRIQRESLEKRMLILEKKRVGRFFYIFYLYFSGFYSNFSGFKSAIKDAVRL